MLLIGVPLQPCGKVLDAMHPVENTCGGVSPYIGSAGNHGQVFGDAIDSHHSNHLGLYRTQVLVVAFEGAFPIVVPAAVGIGGAYTKVFFGHHNCIVVSLRHEARTSCQQ